ncbi:hypothetical protein MKX01_026483 [Papaver californicum]|nr:hypothetical protein MKX01_026483 [Papaver californicum]
MKCSICGFRFCWICLVSLKNHSCNKYKDGGADDSTERKTARKHLGKYTHYYQRWAANHKSMDHAVKYVKNMQTCAREELKFIKDAREKIIECRRVLKWSYAFGYYLPEHEHAKIHFFEYVQGVAESGLEGLHRFAEEELQTCLDSETPLENFKIFCNTLEKKTTDTGYYFESLSNAFKNGLSEVHSQGVGSSNGETATDEYEGRKYGRCQPDDEFSDDDEFE